VAHPPGKFASASQYGRRSRVTAELIDCREPRTLLGAAAFADGTEYESIHDIRPHGTYLAMRIDSFEVFVAS
jgi:hypothetical protein